MNDVQNPICGRVVDDCTIADCAAAIDRRQSRETPVEIIREMRQSLLQSRWELAVSLEVFLQPRGKIPTTFCQSRRQITRIPKIFVDDAPMIRKEDDRAILIFVLFL
jgi:hypothetical protein